MGKYNVFVNNYYYACKTTSFLIIPKAATLEVLVVRPLTIGIVSEKLLPSEQLLSSIVFANSLHSRLTIALID